MKKKISYILISIVTILFLAVSSCKKFEDGGNSYRLEKKLQEKTWNLSQVIEDELSNDVDYTRIKRWNVLLFDENKEFYIDAKKVGTYYIKDKTAVIINITDTAYTFFKISNIESEIYFEINKLKNNNLSLSHSETYLNYERN